MAYFKKYWKTSIDIQALEKSFGLFHQLPGILNVSGPVVIEGVHHVAKIMQIPR